MNKRGNYNNTPTERGCCHQPEPVLFSSPEKIRTGNENVFFLAVFFEFIILESTQVLILILS